MKKFAVILGLLLMFVQTAAFADEIISQSGKVNDCKIISVENGLIEYKKDGNSRSFMRESASPIFNDYVDVQTNLISGDSIIRYKGNIIIKDMQEVIILTNEGYVKVPWFKVRKIGIYKP
jgi:hypothetical protein